MNKIIDEILLRKVRKEKLTNILTDIKNDVYQINDESSELYNIAFKLNQIQQRCTLLKLKQSSYDMYNNILNDIKNDIPTIMKRNGCSFQLFLKYYPVSHEIKYKSILCNTFQIYKIEELGDDETVPELDPMYNEYAKNNKMFFRKIYPPFKNSLDENINGSKIFIPYKNS